MTPKSSPPISFLTIVFGITNVAFAFMTLSQNQQIERLNAARQIPVIQTQTQTQTPTPAVSAPTEQAGSRTTTDFESINTRKELSGKAQLTFDHKCKGEVKMAVPAQGGFLDQNTGEKPTYCIGENRLTVTDATGVETVVDTRLSTKLEDAPVLLKINRVVAGEPGSRLVNLEKGTWLIEYGVFACTLSEDSCGVGLPANNVTYAYDVATKKARPITSFPEFGTAIWNRAGTKALFSVVQVGGAGCTNGPLTGYDLTADAVKSLTKETGCPFDDGTSTDVDGKPVQVWGPTFWTSDTAFTTLLLGLDNKWKQIDGAF